LRPLRAIAQSTGITASEAAELDTVTVTGIRGSLQSSMNLKRDSVGVMDDIMAKDIGKFPDGNLAESMQCISGASIDRTTGGIGAAINIKTARPLNNPGFRATIGVKGVMDKAADRLPRTYPGNSIRRNL